MINYSRTKNIAIFTNFQDFNPGYSLSGIVVDQARMLLKYGHKVYIFVNEQYNHKFDILSGIVDLERHHAGDFEVVKKSKFMHLKDYQTENDLTEEHKEEIKKAIEIYFNEIKNLKIDIVLTHDFIFTGWNLPYAKAIQEVNKILISSGKIVLWYNWIHSVPSAHKDWWELERYGKNSFVVFPNKTEEKRIMDMFHTLRGVKVIPHIKDIRTWYDFGDEANQFIDVFPNILRSEVVQIYPCSTDRLSAKQLEIVIKIFGYMKTEARLNVFLCAANQWATGRQRKEDIEKYMTLAERCGLKNNINFVFTSEIRKEYETGISKRMIRELQLLSNLFIFPTREESFGLVGPEASFSGALVVSNKSLLMMKEVLGINTLEYEFSSFQVNAPIANDENYIRAVALSIVHKMSTNEAIMTKNYCMQRYNMDHIYQRYYLPLMY